MEERALKIQTMAFKALAHPTRIAILEMMREGPVCSCEMEPELGLRQPNIAQHLGVLRNSQLVTSYRDGSRVMYTVVDTRVFDVLDMIKTVMYDVLDESTQALAVAGETAN